MKLQNGIGWTDETTNAVTGCTPCSSGCKNCYARTGTRARVLRAAGIETWGPNAQRMLVKGYAAKLRYLDRLSVCDKCAEAVPTPAPGQFPGMERRCPVADCGGPLRRPRCFADSNSDWLDEAWPNEVLANFVRDITEAVGVDVLLLTKRPELFFSRMVEALAECDEGSSRFQYIRQWLDGKPPSNVWIGASTENAKCAAERIPLLLSIPAKIRFLSCEPLLESFSIREAARTNRKPDGLDWAIIGGESGYGARDCGVEAINALAAECVTMGLPVYVKQDCNLHPGQRGRIPDGIWSLKQFPEGRA